MSFQVSPQKGRRGTRESAAFSSVYRAFSERPKRRAEAGLATRSCSRPLPETLTYLLMKEKFEQIYRHIERISLGDEPLLKLPHPHPERETQPEVPGLSVNSLQLETKAVPDPSLLNSSLQKKVSTPKVGGSALQINTAGESRARMKGHSLKEQMRKSRYRRKMLEPLSVGKTNLSNNIKDYLSVEKIAVRDGEETALAARARRMKQPPSPAEGVKLSQSEVALEWPSSKRQRAQKVVVRRVCGKFKAPFPLYYYRDFMWRVAFSNQFLVEVVGEYEGKFKYFVGAGNNSNLIKGLMRRRPWFQLTDKPQDANFVWTQIKIPSVFSTQKKNEPPPALEQASNKSEGQGFLLFNTHENAKWREYWGRNMQRQRTMKESLRARSRLWGVTQRSVSQVRALRVHNHFCHNFLIGNKKALFQTMSEYYSSRGERVFDHLPLTFHIKNGIEDDQYLAFLQHYYAIARANKAVVDTPCRNAWIVKPGQNSNRGNGILVCLELGEIKAILRRKEKHGDGSLKTYILQQYIERPLLYRRRKFDLRHYLMLTCVNGCLKGYWYRHGYVRTTSSEYSLSGTAAAVHLTNDAVQKTLPDYGRFEKGNKITYDDLDAFLRQKDPAFDFRTVVYPQMRATAVSAIRASAVSLDPQRRSSNFEVFGLDFMIDADYRVWLIEVNTNPCLETTCPVLSAIIPAFLEHAFQIALDPLFPAPLTFAPAFPDYHANLADHNAFELVFDERIDGPGQVGPDLAAQDDEEEVFDDDGADFED